MTGTVQRDNRRACRRSGKYTRNLDNLGASVSTAISRSFYKARRRRERAAAPAPAGVVSGAAVTATRRTSAAGRRARIRVHFGFRCKQSPARGAPRALALRLRVKCGHGISFNGR
ncbi:hypothetical protein EVAR_43260_1 [Eumeta japonica]|uniref:Uncharacterized protein n=1 Tax=Eumeta variegata TaxID=151549 RepID=A0A4C1WVZ2_EUMVA|nr:hypothetical protein EVAR_43260_1 [Eumeta japonica]